MRDPRTSFHVEDLQKSMGHLAHVSSDRLPFFAVSLTYVVLINQMMHSHFRAHHQRFRERARYPLVAGGMNPSRSPYAVLEESLWSERGVPRSTLEAAWRDLVGHLQPDVVEYLTGAGADHGLTWSNFRDAMLGDREAVDVPVWGETLKQALES